MFNLSKSLSIALVISLVLIIFSILIPIISFAQNTPTITSNKYSTSSIRVKLKNPNNSSLLNKSSGSSVEVFGSNTNINNVNFLQIKPLFANSAPESKNVAPQGYEVSPETTELSKYYVITVPEGSDTLGLSKQLKQLPEIEEAYPTPLPAPLPSTPNFEARQVTRMPEPRGTNSSFSEKWPGAHGGSVKIIDIEDSWNVYHEDLPRTLTNSALIKNGTPITDPKVSNTDHGTAVLGVLVGVKNSFGVTGIVPKARIGMVNAHNKDGSPEYNVSTAIVLAANNLVAGDVILIEQQTWGPTANSLVPVEYLPEAYDAIRYATSKNIVVIEAAGNGNEDLDNLEYYGSPFPFNKPNSGAIMVGAGSACTNTGAPLRSKLWFSNYGKRLDLQGSGDCVVTTGVGNLYKKGSINSYYTHTFNGTSSASAVVAGNVASYVSAYKTLNGVAPKIDNIKSTFKNTGTPQNESSSNTLKGNIGPLPNLYKALLKTDVKPPSTPGKLTASVNSRNKVVLNWQASTDNVSINNYKIICNYVNVGNSNKSLTFTFEGSKPKTTYHCGVIAVDQSVNASAMSNIVKITTK